MRSSETYTPTIEGTLPDFYKSFENFSQIPRTIKLGYNKHSLVEKEAGNRYGNVSEVRMEIRYGTDYQSVFELQKVLIDYIKTPQQILLTQEQLDRVEDTSQMLEFPDYVCQEIVNELVHIVMELISDPRFFLLISQHKQFLTVSFNGIKIQLILRLISLSLKRVMRILN